jgi:hypothetical protein
LGLKIRAALALKAETLGKGMVLAHRLSRNRSVATGSRLP